MKKILPFIFPILAVVIVIFLASRWYESRTNEKVTNIDNGISEGVKIEDLSQTESEKLKAFASGIGDFKSVDLIGDDESEGKIRYEIKDNKIYLSIFATLPISDEIKDIYQVWIKGNNQNDWQKTNKLEFTKGGYLTNLAISDKYLPLEVLVSKELIDDTTIENIVLKGIIIDNLTE